jgi:hypothetical protein
VATLLLALPPPNLSINDYNITAIFHGLYFQALDQAKAAYKNTYPLCKVSPTNQLQHNMFRLSIINKDTVHPLLLECRIAERWRGSDHQFI